jgi:transposase
MEKQANDDLRRYARARMVTLYAVAKKFGVSEATIYRWLRVRFNAKQASQFRKYVRELVQEHAERKKAEQ